MNARRGPASRVRVRVIDAGASVVREEAVTTEEPLEIRVSPGLVTPHGVASAPSVPVSVTMRTPGHDFELAVGFLYGEGVLRSREDVRSVRYCTDVGEEQLYNTVTVDLAPGVELDLPSVVRRTPTSSACGVCGVSSLAAVAARCTHELSSSCVVRAEVVAALPDALRAHQKVFDRTGGLHGAALFTPDGELLAVREDVGRHNAVDKLVGWALLERRLPLSEHVLCVSGRIGFEIAQKAVMAGIPVLAAVSAPSSLAVDLARDRGLTLIGFVRQGRLTVYSRADRVVAAQPDTGTAAMAAPVAPTAVPTAAPASRSPRS
ncbi:MAG: formate dehydrogenase accessory sulfurtransferase FdhD [Actinomycetes bacterium]